MVAAVGAIRSATLVRAKPDLRSTQMPRVEESPQPSVAVRSGKLPVTVIVPVRNEARNLPRCLDSLAEVSEVIVVDSQSTDATVEIARAHKAEVVQFHYQGGWPKKRQWAMDNLSITHDWILLLDADEVMTPELTAEIQMAIQNPEIQGYYLALRIFFLDRVLRHGGATFWKLSLFRRGKGRYECRLKDQDASMADMEVHEHVYVNGPTARLHNPLIHHNVDSLSRYIQKHDEYSNWEARVLSREESEGSEISASLFGTQAQRRRWLKEKLFSVPGSPVGLFLYRYLFRLGFLDGVPGLIYCGFQAVQMFHTKSKIYELRSKRG
jgi:glycosyltransferase involved in cell wall biosynthesis